MDTQDTDARNSSNFIRDAIDADLAAGRHTDIVTRFPPEPNGYLHIGHGKAVCINFGIARDYGGRCHLRFDDTNPDTEEQEFIDAIMEDIAWLGFDWGSHLYFASDYFGQMYDYAARLIEMGKAYVCDLSQDAFKEYRGVPSRPGIEPPSRKRSVAENLDLFRRMRNGEFEDGAYVLRARIDMASPNIHMRDPAIFRIKRAAHPRTGNRWRIYPMYDFAHCLEDSIERITHSLCSLEFEVHRPLYDWILETLAIWRPQQIEFSRLNLSYTVMSKRKLRKLIEDGHVNGWDDPRLPTLRGLRRRGYTPASIRAFCEDVGVTKFDGLTDVARLEHSIRDELNRTAPRRMGVFDPLKVVIENYPADGEEWIEGMNNPENPADGSRRVPFARELYIEREDFMENPPPKFHRLAPGREVRLRHGYIIACTDILKAPDGTVNELRCRYDPETRGGNAPDGRKVKGAIHWVSARHARRVEARLFDRLFNVEEPEALDDFTQSVNPASLRVVDVLVEPAALDLASDVRLQFERKGYFFPDPRDSAPGRPVFNRIVPLKDRWSKQNAKDA